VQQLKLNDVLVAFTMFLNVYKHPTMMNQ